MARKLVSQKKKRYVQDGFDLDLSCECVFVALSRKRERERESVREREGERESFGRRQTMPMVLTQRRADIPNDSRRIVAMGIPIPRKLVCGDTDGENHPLFKEARLTSTFSLATHFLIQI